MNEQWLPVTGYEGFYEVSDLGKVRRIAPEHGATVGRICSQKGSRSGYPRVTLTRKSISTTPFIHRIVAAAFIGPCPLGKEVNHKDGNRLNPALTNLEYVTRKENVAHALRNLVACPVGHSYTASNRTKDGRRRCRICKRQRDAARYKRRKKQEIESALKGER